MNSLFRQLAIVIILTLAATIQPKQAVSQSNEIGFQVFYDALSPYGQWVDYQNYGYVWIPDVGEDFAPYSTDGYWVYTDFGWTWVSDYEWGWAPFHYGRWDYDNYYGWLWVPDNEWGPSWVNWRMADGYYGWCPMEPGISITLGFNSPYNRDNDHWMFVRGSDFERRDINRYSVDHMRHAEIFRNSTIINKVFIDNSRHTTYVTGPTRKDVQRSLGHQITPVSIRNNSRPGKDQNDGNLRMYRPEIVKNSRSASKPAPGRVEKLQDVKPPSERNSNRMQPVREQQLTSPSVTREREQINRSQPIRTQPQNAPVRNNERQPQQNINRTPPSQQQEKTVPDRNNTRQQQQTAPDRNKERQQQNINRTQPSQQQQRVTPAVNNNRQQQQQLQQQQQQRQQQEQQQRQEQQQQQQQQPRQQQQQQLQQQQRQQRQQLQQQQQTAPVRTNEREQQQNRKVQPSQQPQQVVPVNKNRQQQNPVKQENQKGKERQQNSNTVDDKEQSR